MNSQLYWQIHRIAFLLEKKADEALREQLGVGFAQYKVLEAISHNSLAKQNTIADQLDQTEASISRQIKLLQSKGLITVTQVMGNKRARELSLTMQGEEMVSQALQILTIAVDPMLGALNQKEQMVLQDIFSKMLSRAKNDTQLSDDM